MHSKDCPSLSALANESERILDVEWDELRTHPFPTQISIVTEDKPGLLAKISNAVAGCDVNIIRANVQQGPLQRAYFDMSVEIKDLEHLNQTLAEIRKVSGVIYAERVKEYGKRPGKLKSSDELESQSGGKGVGIN